MRIEDETVDLAVDEFHHAGGHQNNIAKVLQYVRDRMRGDQTFDDKCYDLGLKQYDFSLPQTWFDMVTKTRGFPNPSGHVVWCYDQFETGSRCTFGYPVAVTEKGRAILGSLLMGI